MTVQLDIAKLARSVGKLPDDAKPTALRPGLRIGLVNNMPDGALVATEQQFSNLVKQATNGQVQLQLFFLPSLSRGPAVTQILQERYRPITDLYHGGIDALIVTGNEPRAARLDEEPYWPEMTALIDWARLNTASTFLSCLAAHAAVLHLDKIERRRLPSKRSGAYLCKTQNDRRNLPQSLLICHSRLNEVSKCDLENAGYEILSQSIAGEVDIFTKAMPSRFLFLQGHPEYDVQSLGREYRRDVDRYLNGTRDDYPAIPENYFDATAVEDYQAFRKQAEKRRAAEMIAGFPSPRLRPDLTQDLAKSAAAIFAFWLKQISEVVADKQREPKRRT